MVALAGGLIAMLAAIVRRLDHGAPGHRAWEIPGVWAAVRMCGSNARSMPSSSADWRHWPISCNPPPMAPTGKSTSAGSTSYSGQAEKATREGQFEEALKHYVHAISYMMAELREQHRRTRQGPDVIRVAGAENPLQAILRQDAIPAAGEERA